MPTATDLLAPAWTRRGWLQRIAAGAVLGPAGLLTARAAAPSRFAAAWEHSGDEGRWRIGVLQAEASALFISASLEVRATMVCATGMRKAASSALDSISDNTVRPSFKASSINRRAPPMSGSAWCESGSGSCISIFWF